MGYALAKKKHEGFSEDRANRNRITENEYGKNVRSMVNWDDLLTQPLQVVEETGSNNKTNETMKKVMEAMETRNRSWKWERTAWKAERVRKE